MKVLCHEGSRTAKLNALHESVVCAHVQHPNVVSFSAYCLQRSIMPVKHAQQTDICSTQCKVSGRP